MNAMTNGAVRDKGELAAEAWGVLGNVSAEEVAAWLLKEKGVEVSIASIRRAKPDSLKKGGAGNGGKKFEGSGEEVTATELRRIKSIAAEGEGLAELEALLKRAQEIADAAGSLERAREIAATLRELQLLSH